MPPDDVDGADGANEPRCKGVRADGSPCQAPPSFVQDNGWCPSHDPDNREKLQEAARKGGEATARRLQEAGLDPEELPPLVDADAAETWCDKVGRAAVTGRIGHNEANAALRAVREWRESHESGAVSDRLNALTDALAEWRRTGSPEAVLEVVDGGEG